MPGRIDKRTLLPCRSVSTIMPSHNPGRWPHLSTLMDCTCPQYCCRWLHPCSPAAPCATLPRASAIQASSSTAALIRGIGIPPSCSREGPAMSRLSGAQGSASAVGLHVCSMQYVINFSAGDVQACVPPWTGATATDSMRQLTTGIVPRLKGAHTHRKPVTSGGRRAGADRGDCQSLAAIT